MLRKIIKIAICFLVAILYMVSSLSAQERGGREVDIKIYFPYDESYIDSTYMDNPRNLHLIDSLLSDSTYLSAFRYVEITAQSSPEGRVSYNQRLSERRKESLRKYFTERYPDVDKSLWVFKSVAENWALFHQHLVDDPDLPSREELLAISECDRDADAKEWLMRKLHGGRPWSYIRENILPSQRFGADVLFIPLYYASIAKPVAFGSDEPAMMRSIPQYVPPADPKLLFAIKSNLVLDALSVINIGVEIPIGERWSVMGEVVHPWWRVWSCDYTMQIESYHGEVKYWLGDRSTRDQLEGWSVGAYGGWGRYDIQPFSPTGVQGTFKDFGLELGYSHSIAKNLNLEYTVGLGYVSTEYEDYKMANDTDEYGDIKVIPYPWKTNKLRSILPTRCGISLVWLIKTKGGARR